MIMWKSITDMCRQKDEWFCQHRMNRRLAEPCLWDGFICVQYVRESHSRSGKSRCAAKPMASMTIRAIAA